MRMYSIRRYDAAEARIVCVCVSVCACARFFFVFCVSKCSLRESLLTRKFAFERDTGVMGGRAENELEVTGTPSVAAIILFLAYTHI